jgi:hypothetical protein
LLWCVRWRRVSAQAGDWSGAKLDPALLAHIAGRVELFLGPDFLMDARRHIRS